MFPKHYEKNKYRKKFRRYYRFFFLSVALFLIFLAVEIVLYGSGGRGAVTRSVSFSALFPPLFCGEAMLYLFTFLLGITVYAPAFQLLSAALRGIFSGFILSSLFQTLGGGDSVILFLLVLLYCLISTQLFCGYASFCTTVSLRLFTDGTLKRYPASDSRMFGGTLFHSEPFCNTVNFRFLFSYCLIFFVALFLLSAHVLAYSFFRSLMG